MACGSCGGARTYTVTAASGEQKPAYVSKVVYVTKWISADGSESKEFSSEAEAMAHVKLGHPGTLMAAPKTV